jgi:hypothetical protein
MWTTNWRVWCWLECFNKRQYTLIKIASFIKAEHTSTKCTLSTNMEWTTTEKIILNTQGLQSLHQSNYAYFTLEINHYANCSQTRECVQLKEQPGWFSLPCVHCLPYIQTCHGTVSPRTKLFFKTPSCRTLCMSITELKWPWCRCLNLLDSTWKSPLQSHVLYCTCIVSLIEVGEVYLVARAVIAHLFVRGKGSRFGHSESQGWKEYSPTGGVMVNPWCSRWQNFAKDAVFLQYLFYHTICQSNSNQPKVFNLKINDKQINGWCIWLVTMNVHKSFLSIG